MPNFTYRAAHDGDKVIKVNKYSNQMLNKLEKEYRAVFSEPMHYMWEYRKPFYIPLIDISK